MLSSLLDLCNSSGYNSYIDIYFTKPSISETNFRNSKKCHFISFSPKRRDGPCSLTKHSSIQGGRRRCKGKSRSGDWHTRCTQLISMVLALILLGGSTWAFFQKSKGKSCFSLSVYSVLYMYSCLYYFPTAHWRDDYSLYVKEENAEAREVPRSRSLEPEFNRLRRWRRLQAVHVAPVPRYFPAGPLSPPCPLQLSRRLLEAQGSVAALPCWERKLLILHRWLGSCLENFQCRLCRQRNVSQRVQGAPGLAECRNPTLELETMGSRGTGCHLI